MTTITTPLAHPFVNKPPKASPARTALPIRLPSNRTEERMLRLLARMHCWECPSCAEIYPAKTDPFFGVCEQCWCGNEDLDAVVDFSKVTPYEIERHYRKWIGPVYAAFAPWGNRRKYNRPPVEHDYLLSMVNWIGEDAIMAALAKFNCPFYRRIDALRWTDRGLAPYAAKNLDDVSSDDDNAWKAIHALALIPTTTPEPTLNA